MTIADIGLSIIIYLVQGLTAILPVNLPVLNFEIFSNYLNSVKNNIINIFSTISFFFPIKLFLILFSIMIFAEIFLFSFKVVKFVINLVRGAGA